MCYDSAINVQYYCCQVWLQEFDWLILIGLKYFKAKILLTVTIYAAAADCVVDLLKFRSRDNKQLVY